jgi:hypothetical protein
MGTSRSILYSTGELPKARNLNTSPRDGEQVEMPRGALFTIMGTCSGSWNESGTEEDRLGSSARDLDIFSPEVQSRGGFDQRGGHTPLREHMPKSHRAQGEWTPKGLIEWGLSVWGSHGRGGRAHAAFEIASGAGLSGVPGPFELESRVRGQAFGGGERSRGGAR